MSTIGVSKTLTALAVVVLTAAPAVAQEARRREGRQEGQEGQARSGGERRRPRGDDAQQGRREPPRAESDGGRRSEANQAVPRREAVPRGDAGRRNDQRNRDEARRIEPQRGRDRDRDGWRDNGPRYLPAPRAYRGYSARPRVYAVPYGYRPRGYRPGWSLNLYFGRPFGNYYSYPGYYGQGAYGYFGIPSGFAYGSLRIVDAPRDAQVFVDGYYAGIVDDYDGVFQRLNLEPGRHTVEIDVYPGVPPMGFDVYVEPGRTVTIHARP